MEGLDVHLWDFDGDQDACQEESHGVCHGGYHGAWTCSEGERADKVPESQGSRIDATELEQCRRLLVAVLSTDIASFRAKEGVQDQLNAVRLLTSG